MTQIIERVVNGRDNAIELTLTEDGVSITHPSITRLQVVSMSSGSVLADSDVDPSSFTFSTDRLIMKLGLLAALITEGSYIVKLVVYSVSSPNGIDWSPYIQLDVE